MVNWVLSVRFARTFIIVLFSFVLVYLVVQEKPVHDLVVYILTTAVGFAFGEAVAENDLRVS